MSGEDTLNALLQEVRSLRKEVSNLSKLTAPFGVYMGDGTVLTQSAQGLRFYVYADDQILLPKLIGNRIWEPSVTRHLMSSINPDADFIDVGANIGYFSCLAASRLDRKKASVFAFEPNPRAMDLLVRNTAINWSLAKIHVSHFALAETEGEVTLFTPRRLIGNASIYDMRNPGESYGEGDTVSEVKIPTRTLDSQIAEKDRVGTIKIDVEGAELGVLRGAEEILRASKGVEVVMEWSRAQLDRAPGGADSVLAFLDDHHLMVREIGKAENPPIPLESLAQISYTNIFLRKD